MHSGFSSAVTRKSNSHCLIASDTARAIEGCRATGYRLFEAQMILDAIRLLPQHHEVVEWAPVAREILEGVEALPYLAKLEEFLAAAAQPRSTTQMPAGTAVPTAS